MAATGRELEGVGEQIAVNLYNLVGIGGYGERLLKAKGAEFYLLIAGGKGERHCDVAQKSSHVGVGHFEAQRVVLELVEVEQLIYELEHAFDVGVGDG